MGEFRMPSLGADMSEGTVLEWLVHPGDVVHRGDIVAVVDTDKADIEVEIWEDGVIDELITPVGSTVPVGTVLATTRPAVTAVAVPAEPAPPEPVHAPQVAIVPDLTVAPPPAPAPVRSPLVRKLAQRRGVDLATVRGSGPGGVVRRRDIERVVRPRATPLARRRAATLDIDLRVVPGSGPSGAVLARDLAGIPEAPPTPPALPEAKAANRRESARRTMGTLMHRAAREIPHYYLTTHVDLGRALAWLDSHNATVPVEKRLLPAAMLLKVVALAARETPEVNGFYEADRFRPADAVHLGVAVWRRDGTLVVPAIHDADRLALPDLMAALRDLVGRVRAGRLRSSEAAAATLTVTNLGDLGVEEVYPIIHPPQVAIVGFGRVVERPWAEAGMVGVRPVVAVTLAADHRVSAGREGARFLAAVALLLETPEEL